MHTVAVLLAGGRGERLQGSIPKQFLLLGGRTLLQRCLDTLQNHAAVQQIVLVTAADFLDKTMDLAHRQSYPKVVKVVPGGSTRQESSRLGVLAIESDVENVLIHDVARPLLPSRLIDYCLQALKHASAVVTAIHPTDSLFIASGREGHEAMEETVDRSRLRLAQTPQGFKLNVIRSAHQRAQQEGKSSFSDDASLVLHYRLADVAVVPGAAENIKITQVQDIIVAEALLRLLAADSPELEE